MSDGYDRDPFYGLYCHTKPTQLEKIQKCDFEHFIKTSFKDEINAEAKNIEYEDEDRTLDEIKEQYIQEIHDIKVYEESVKPISTIVDRKNEENEFKLNSDILSLEFRNYYHKHQDWAVKNKMSYQTRKVPSSLLPNVAEGNYSLLLHDKSNSDVHDWIKRDLRTASSALDHIYTDLQKFEQFNNLMMTVGRHG